MKKATVPGIMLLIVLVLCTGCTQSTSPPAAGTPPVAAISPATTPGYVDITPAQAKDLIATEKELVIIDVSPYYADGHLPGAVSIPLDTLDAKIPVLDRTKTYLVYCHGDGPSIAGAQKLVDAGFPRVYRLAGNYAAWTGAGYEVSTVPAMISETMSSTIPMAAAGTGTGQTPAQATDLITTEKEPGTVDV